MTIMATTNPKYDQQQDQLLPQHQALLDASGISSEVAQARGYRSGIYKDDLAGLGFEEYQRLPGLLLPVWTVDGNLAFHQLRPDEPRTKKSKKGDEPKPIKYETPKGQRLVIDVPPGIRDELADPRIPLFITEGIRKADCAVSFGYTCIDLLGVTGWRGTNDFGGRTALACLDRIAFNGRRVYLTFDSDVVVKKDVKKALDDFTKFLESKQAVVYQVLLPGGPYDEKVGLDDYLMSYGREAFDALVVEAETARDFLPSRRLTRDLTDTDDAEDFAGRYREILAWSPHLKTWIAWESELTGSGIGGRWVEDYTLKAKSAVKLTVNQWLKEAMEYAEQDQKLLLLHALRSKADHKLEDILKCSRDRLVVNITIFDADPSALNCRNGLVNLKTGTIRTASPADKCRWQAAVEYVPGYTDPQFTRFLKENIPDEQTRAFIQEVCGYILTGDRSAEVFFYFYGPKRSGKSTLAIIIQSALGSYAATVPSEFFMTTDRALDANANRPLLASLVNKRVIIAAEGDKAHKFNAAFVKQITGGDTVSACAKFKDPFEYRPKFVPLLHGNHRPTVEFTEDAFRSRLIELPFSVGHEPDKVDEGFKRYLVNDPSPRKAWLAWAMEGLQRLMARGMKFLPPPEVKASTAAYWEEQNILGPFVSRMVLDKEGFIPSTDLNAAFAKWRVEDGDIKKLDITDLQRWLKEKGCESKLKKIDGKAVRGWFGVRWADGEAENG